MYQVGLDIFFLKEWNHHFKNCICIYLFYLCLILKHVWLSVFLMDIFVCIRSMCLVCTLSWFCVLLFLLHIWMLTKKVSTHLNISCKHSNIMKKLWLNWDIESYIALLTLLRKALHFILSIIHSFFLSLLQLMPFPLQHLHWAWMLQLHLQMIIWLCW